MRTVLGLLSLLGLGGAALMQPATPALAQGGLVAPAPSKTAVDTKAAPPIEASASGRKRRTMRRKGAATRQAAPSALPASRQSCLDLWEPATHMTRRQWARACSGLDRRLTAATLR